MSGRAGLPRTGRARRVPRPATRRSARSRRESGRAGRRAHVCNVLLRLQLLLHPRELLGLVLGLDLGDDGVDLLLLLKELAVRLLPPHLRVRHLRLDVIDGGEHILPAHVLAVRLGHDAPLALELHLLVHDALLLLLQVHLPLLLRHLHVPLLVHVGLLELRLELTNLVRCLHDALLHLQVARLLDLAPVHFVSQRLVLRLDDRRLPPLALRRSQ